MMKVWVQGDQDGQFSQRLGRYLAVEVVSGHPPDDGRDVLVALPPGSPDDPIALAGTQLLILVEPEQQARDRIIRALAGTQRPRLKIVEHVAAGIQAERTWALLLSLLTGIPRAIDAVRSTMVTRSDLVQGAPEGGSWLSVPSAQPLEGLTIGFIGFGPMAWNMSGWARQMGMRALFSTVEPGSHDQVEVEQAALRSGAEHLDLADVLSIADAVVLDLEYSESSVRLIDSAELALMPADAFLVNTSHGRAIDEGALLQALNDGRLGGVALDRFNYEPLPADSRLRELEHVVLTPGIATPEHDTVLERTARQVAQVIWDVTAGGVARRVRYVRRRAASRSRSDAQER